LFIIYIRSSVDLKWGNVDGIEIVKSITNLNDASSGDSDSSETANEAKGGSDDGSMYKEGGTSGNKPKQVVVGCLFKELAKKISPLNEFDDERGQQEPNYHLYEPATQDICGNMTSEDDLIYLEDHSGRMPVCMGGDLSMDDFCSGSCLGILGDWIEGDIFEIEQVCHPFPLLKSPSPPVESPNPSNPSILLVSGLLFGYPSFNPSFSSSSSSYIEHQMLTNFICGNLGGEDEKMVASNICRVVICGNSMINSSSSSSHFNNHTFSSPSNDKLSNTRKNQNKASPDSVMDIANHLNPIQELDVFLTQILSSCQVDLMGGETDLTNLCLPQQPLHPLLLPHSSTFSSLSRVPNPYNFSLEVEGRELRIMGTSGQNVNDVRRVTCLEKGRNERMEEEEKEEEKEEEEKSDTNEAPTSTKLLEYIYQGGHICPSAPDTLPTYPFIHEDPYVLPDHTTTSSSSSSSSEDGGLIDGAKMPHIFFAGNQPSFASSLHTIGNEDQALMVSVPSFLFTQEAVLVDLVTLQTHVISFSS